MIQTIDNFIFENQKKYLTDVAFHMVCDQLVSERHAVNDLFEDMRRGGIDVDRFLADRERATLARIAQFSPKEVSDV